MAIHTAVTTSMQRLGSSVAGELQPVVDAIASALREGHACADRSVSVTLPAIAGQTIVVSVRTGGQQGDTQPPVPSRGLDAKQLRLVNETINDRIGEPITVSMLSSIAGLSRSHFSLAFRLSTGRSPHAHVTRLRIERAMTMMLDKRAQLSDIALSSGFADQAHFTKTFRKAAGVTPSQWRRLHAEAISSSDTTTRQ